MDYNNNYQNNNNNQPVDPNFQQNNYVPQSNPQDQNFNQGQYGAPQYQQPQYQQPQYQQPQYQQPQYGAPQYGQPMYNQPVAPDNSKGLAITSLVLGILSFICCGFPFSIAGFICGLVSKSRKKEGNGLATAGIIISIIGFVVTIITMVVMVVSGTFTDLINELYYY